MKAKSIIAAAAAILVMVSSCSILKGGAQSASNSGTSVGAALLGLYTQYKTNGKIDLSNLGNLANLGTILANIGGLSNASSSFVDEFSAGLINGSSNLVNSVNSAKIVSGLSSLANIDTTAILNAANAASAGATDAAKQLSSNPEVASAVSSLVNILGQLKQ